MAADTAASPAAGSPGHDDAIRFDFRRAFRTALDATSWVELVSGWLPASRELFDALARAVPWRQLHRELFGQRRLEPRLTAEYRDLRAAPHPVIAAAAVALSAHYGVTYDSVWLNLYRNGSGGVRPALGRPRRDGRPLPAGLAARRAQDGGTGGPAHQRELPELRAGAALIRSASPPDRHPAEVAGDRDDERGGEQRDPVGPLSLCQR